MPMSAWPIFLLSLDDAAARRARLVGQLEALGLGFEIVSAIDGRTGLSERHEAMIDRAAARANLGRDMADTEYACALSHHLLYRRVRDEGLAGAVVLEDDAILLPHFAGFMAQRAYETAELIALDHWFGRIWRFSGARLTGTVRAGRLSLLPCLTTGYSISAAGCAFMIGNSLPISRTADWPCDIRTIGARAAFPRIVDHDPIEPGGSLMEEQRRALRRNGAAARREESGLRRWFVKRASRKIS